MNEKESHDSIFIKNVQRGINKKILTLSSDNSKITYHCSRDYTENFKDPEEKVRASYFVELKVYQVNNHHLLHVWPMKFHQYQHEF